MFRFFKYIMPKPRTSKTFVDRCTNCGEITKHVWAFDSTDIDSDYKERCRPRCVECESDILKPHKDKNGKCHYHPCKGCPKRNWGIS